ncbi:hypothetical protein T265_16242, partial [Opisthorchis viverrini]
MVEKNILRRENDDGFVYYLVVQINGHLPSQYTDWGHSQSVQTQLTNQVQENRANAHVKSGNDQS